MTSEMQQIMDSRGQARAASTIPSHAAALRTLASATGHTVCPVFAIGPIATFLTGPVAAVRPDIEDVRYADVQVHRRDAADDLIRDVCRLGRGDRISDIGAARPSPHLYVLPQISDGSVSVPQANDPTTQESIDQAIHSGNVDFALPVLDGRLAALLAVCDEARREAGGALDSFTVVAIEHLASTLLGRTRWDCGSGWGRLTNWPSAWSYGLSAMRSNSFLQRPEVAGVIRRRLVEGR